MKLSLETDYAVRIIYCLSSEQSPIKAKEITEKCEITEMFTVKILRKLLLHGLIRSFRGKSSGYMLNRPPSEISFLDVIESIEGKLEIHRCDSGGHRNADSDLKHHCKVNKHMVALNNTLKGALDGLTFDQI